MLWIVLASALVIGTVGVLNSFSLVVSAVVLFLIGLSSVRLLHIEESNAWWNSLHHSYVNVNQISQLPSVLSKERAIETKEENDKITGSPLIDNELNIILEYILRDFVLSWYQKLSGHPDFVRQIHVSMQQLLISVSDRFKYADWFGYLTNQFVEDIAEHLDLYRETAAVCKSDSQKDLVSTFFDREASRQDETRRSICLDKDAEIDYLSDLVEVVLYFIMPPEDFMNIPLRTAIVEIIVSSIFIPLVDQLSHEHSVNSLIVAACSDMNITPETYLHVIRTTTKSQELEAVKKAILTELNHLRSKDYSKREEGAEAKQQIGSLEYLRQVVDARLQRLSKRTAADPIGLSSTINYKGLSRKNLFQLPLQAILKNSLTLDHFLSYMSSINCEHYVALHLDIEGWKSAVVEHLYNLELERINNFQDESSESSMPDLCHDYFAAQDLSVHKAKAEDIYVTYLSEKAEPRVNIDDSILKRFILTLRTESISEKWFDEIHQHLLNSLKDIDTFLPAFKRSDWYIRLLAELDLLKDAAKSDEDESQSLEEFSAGGSDHLTGSNSSPCSQSPAGSHNPSPCHSRVSSLSSKSYSLSAYISKIEMVRERNRSYAKYRVVVTRTITDQPKLEDTWQVSRRYSHFHDFHSVICAKFPDLASISFPSKKMVNNLAFWFLEKRMSELNTWLSRLLESSVIQTHDGLLDEFLKFFDQHHFQSQPVNFSTKVKNNFVTPIGTGVRSVGTAVKSVPDTVFSTVDGIYRKLNKPMPPPKAPYLSADVNQKGSFDIESEENIALRILLVLMDKVFDLGSKDQWFRRRIILFLRQILKAMFGDIVNRRINDYITYITSADQVAQYIQYFKDSTWPGGTLAPPTQEKDMEEQLRTKVAARTCLRACISGQCALLQQQREWKLFANRLSHRIANDCIKRNEFKALLGSETTWRGVLNVYECVQWQAINKRLIYVLLTGILEKIFTNPQHPPDIFRSLISTSARKLKNQSANSRKSARLIS